MSQTRRIKRMSRNTKGSAVAGLNLVSLMDVFTILVFFLLVNSSSSDVMEPPKRIKLPDSTVEAKPRETVIIMITPEQILVQGEPVITTQEVIDSKTATIEPVKQTPSLVGSLALSRCMSSTTRRSIRITCTT